MGHTHETVKSRGEKRTAFVVAFSAVTMVLEIAIGLFSNSMALLADGIHMGSHVLAIGLSWGAYVLVRRLQKKDACGVDGDKVLSLSAYTSGVLLLIFALFIVVEAIERFFCSAGRDTLRRGHGDSRGGYGGEHCLCLCAARPARARRLQQPLGLPARGSRCVDQSGSHLRIALCHDLGHCVDRYGGSLCLLAGYCALG